MRTQPLTMKYLLLLGILCVSIHGFQTDDFGFTRSKDPEAPCALHEPSDFVEDCYFKVLLSKDSPVNITSPGFPCTFPRSFSCQWDLEAPRSYFIQIYLLTLDLPEQADDGNCHVAYLEYGHYDEKYRRVSDSGRRCGKEKRKKIVSPKNTYWLSLTGHWHHNKTSYSGLSVEVRLTSQKKGKVESDPTVVAICAFLVPLFCAFPVYQCFKRMAEVNKRKRLQAKIQRIRDRERRLRLKSVAMSEEAISRTSMADDNSSVFYTIWEEPEDSEDEVGQEDGQVQNNKSDNNNNNRNKLSISRSSLSSSDGELHKTPSQTQTWNRDSPFVQAKSNLRRQVLDSDGAYFKLSNSSPSVFVGLPASTPHLQPPSLPEGTPHRSARKSVTFTDTDLIFMYHTPREELSTTSPRQLS